ncbi:MULTISPECIES: hypothetical protein [Xanthomonas]|uniref:Antitoxin VbhA domain-containing protein n=1 Tax=Xanthomonas translucens pv. translucens DSM 18974 TaxID=1261556 RepID=A0A1C3TRI5_XANCT|nr:MULTISPECIES: hypothetical protein [Xanthomonas]MCC8445370.1 hypothetical protein [Xanthomonas translucens pv. translucens]MDO0839065.1 hypothetical protein [Xanthomonas campestris pv. campestris]UKE50037.1 hypothetical protein KCU57_15135 [Xanthomonas translucens]WLA11583.1 hypothetical protein MO327_15435 [Xanthomonas translucens]CCP41488.1 hypothetical protein BN444_03213 [Xanthomonas translucens pv. translucens DSM 18974]
MTAPEITTKDGSERQRFILEVKAEFKSDGFEITPRIEKLTQLYISGQIDFEDLRKLLTIDTLH